MIGWSSSRATCDIATVGPVTTHLIGHNVALLKEQKKKKGKVFSHPLMNLQHNKTRHNLFPPLEHNTPVIHYIRRIELYKPRLCSYRSQDSTLKIPLKLKGEGIKGEVYKNRSTHLFIPMNKCCCNCHSIPQLSFHSAIVIPLCNCHSK